MNIYIVKSRHGRVWIALADSATEAARIVAQSVADATQTTYDEELSALLAVGRLGDYNPGHEGAALMQAAGGLIG